MAAITEFTGNYRWLSNFWPAPVTIEAFTFPSTEHAYQAAKSLDPRDWNQILVLNPGQAKRYGQRIKLRPDWEQIKLDVMRELTAAKYDQHPDLKRMLLQTKGMELIEGNYWNDTFWGVCRGIGQNHLGRIIMEYRDKE